MIFIIIFNNTKGHGYFFIFVLDTSDSVFLAASVAQLDVHPTGDQEVAGSTLPGWQHSYMEIDHEIFIPSFSPADSRRAVVSF